MIYSSKAREEEKNLSQHRLKQSHLKSNLIRIYPMPDGVGFSFMEKIMLEQIKNIETEDTEEYKQFVDKFKPKKTTDDCYTPKEVYNTVLAWVVQEYDINPDKIIRPFFPGGDYQNAKYLDGYVVVDNPPFSIFKEICNFYEERDIPFFLFSPHLTGLSGEYKKSCFIPVCADVIYENGAKVKTSFRTNLAPMLVRTAPELHVLLKETCSKLKKTRNLPKYRYPQEVFTATIGAKLSSCGIDYRIPRSGAVFIRRLDSQIESGKALFGGGLLLSKKAAAEKAAAEKKIPDDTIAWELSDRERDLVNTLK